MAPRKEQRARQRRHPSSAPGRRKPSSTLWDPAAKRMSKPPNVRDSVRRPRRQRPRSAMRMSGEISPGRPLRASTTGQLLSFWAPSASRPSPRYLLLHKRGAPRRFRYGARRGGDGLRPAGARGRPPSGNWGATGVRGPNRGGVRVFSGFPAIAPRHVQSQVRRRTIIPDHV